jgi:hypothetical protein
MPSQESHTRKIGSKKEQRKQGTKQAKRSSALFDLQNPFISFIYLLPHYFIYPSTLSSKLSFFLSV